MEKVLFIIPPYLDFDSFVQPAFNERTVTKKSGGFGSLATDMPVGVLSLSSYLKKKSSVEIKLIDFNIVINRIENFKYNSFKDLFRDALAAKEWLEFLPDVICLSALFTPSYYNMLDIAGAAKKIFPKALIIAGGGVPTNLYNEIFRDSSCFDALCYGEGEKPLSGLLMAPDKKAFLASHPAWITKEKIEGQQSFQYDFIDDLDEIPFYDYGLLGTDESGLSPSMNTFTSFDGEKNLYLYATSRGCPYHCAFCASHSVHGRKMRYHSLDRVKADLSRLRDQYGAEVIGFLDDHFMADKQRARAIISLVKELKMKLFFQSGLALYALDRKMLEAIRSAGLKQLVLAIESGSSRVLREIMHKPLDLSTVKRVIADCRELGIDTDANILIGLPGETKQDIEDSRTFLKSLEATWFRIYIATPLAGSELLQISLKNNYLRGSYIDCDYKKAAIETEEFTAGYIQEKAYSLNLELNFVGNSDFRLGNYAVALKGFENALRVKNDHAFACYFAAKCCKVLNLSDKYQVYKEKYQEIINGSEIWRKYARQFGLAAL